MNTIKRALSRIACFANCHPHAVLALVFAAIMAFLLFVMVGAVALVTTY
jgi:hypothetical protein